MRLAVFLPISTLLFCIIVCTAHADDDVIRRRETLALFRGFLCYIKGESIKNCKSDRDVTSIIHRLEGDAMTEEVRERLRPKPAIVSNAAFPLPPQEARKRDAFYSDWKRK